MFFCYMDVRLSQNAYLHINIGWLGFFIYYDSCRFIINLAVLITSMNFYCLTNLPNFLNIFGFSTSNVHRILNYIHCNTFDDIYLPINLSDSKQICIQISNSICCSNNIKIYSFTFVGNYCGTNWLQFCFLSLNQTETKWLHKERLIILTCNF